MTDAGRAKGRDGGMFLPVTMGALIAAEAAALLSLLIARQGSLAAAFVFGSALVDALWALSARFYAPCGLRAATASGAPRLLARHLGAAALIGVALEAGTLAGAPAASVLVLADWRPLRMAIFTVIGYVLALAWLVLARRGLVARAARAMREGVRRARVWLRRPAHSALALVAVGGGVFLAWAISRAGGYRLGAVLVFVLSAEAVAAHLLYCATARRAMPAITFAVVAFSAGCSIIAAFPVSNMMSWDDQIHYQHAVGISYVVDEETTASDRALFPPLDRIEPGFAVNAGFNRFPIDRHQTWFAFQVALFERELNEHADAASVRVTPGLSEDVTSVSVLAHAPAAAGLWLGRLLHLPFTATFVLGRLSNLAVYCAIGYAAIRLIPCKKLLLAVLLLLPLNVFVASNYSYDYWVTALTALGLALFVREYGKKGAPDLRAVAASFGVLVLAFAPKAVYFPILGIVFLLLFSRRISGRAARRAVAYAVGAVLVLGLLVMLPILFSATGDVSDLRGGDGVNSSKQVAFILADVPRFIGIVAHFLVHEYLPIPIVENHYLSFAFFSDLVTVAPYLVGFTSAFIGAVALLDSNRTSMRLVSWPGRLWMSFVAVATLYLICTALYISYTAVGAGTVAGVQPRYLVPLLIPVMLFIFNLKISVERRPGVDIGFCAAGAVVLFACVWLLIVSRVIV